MIFVDSHCHLNYDPMQNDIAGVLQRAAAVDIHYMMAIGTCLKKAQEVIDIAQNHDPIFATVGVHPHEVDEEGVPDLDTLRELAQRTKVVGLGETGLDYFYDHSDRDNQKESFRRHIRLAKELTLPLIIHARAAEADILEILKEERVDEMDFPGVIHCFTGTKEFAEATMAMGFYISISGIVTFKKAEELREIVKAIPLEKLLVETDAPYLAPTPFRGKPNEPSLMIHTAKEVARLKGCSLEELANITTENYFNIFQKAVRVKK